MTHYCIVEDENGWTVLDHPQNVTAEETAHRAGVRLIDSGPYLSWDDANEALEALLLEATEADGLGTPDLSPLEGRTEERD